jgi:hypothetical protein
MKLEGKMIRSLNKLGKLKENTKGGVRNYCIIEQVNEEYFRSCIKKITGW